MTGVSPQVLRYLVNGVIATLVHYAVLSLNLGLFGFRSAGLANFVAALFGIGASFLGSYLYVFPTARGRVVSRLVLFGGLYGLIAVLHGLLLWLWTDLCGADWRTGFVLATAVQMSISYLGNKHVVFR